MRRSVCSFSWLLCLLCVTAVTAAKPGDPAFTDPQEAGPDFAIQGEYVGTVGAEYGPEEWGAHVIALGDGKFRLVGYLGGLPGDGWSRGGDQELAEGEANDGAVIFYLDRVDVQVKNGGLTVIADGETIGKLPKVDRKSPTLGAKPPEDAVVLFDGSSADHFTDGELVGNLLAATGCYSRQKFGDHSLHLEFRHPFMPKSRGQGRGNSGVYIQSRYELQILDSFGLEGENNECGGFYKVAKPLVNMCLPPLSWQTYDIDFTAARYDDSGNKTKNARVTVRHNGVVIHEDLELPEDTPGRYQEGPGPEALFLQDHGNPVVFRNIWVVPK